MPKYIGMPARKPEPAPPNATSLATACIAETEILALCRRFLDVHGARAEPEACRRRDRLLADDDFEGFLVWSRIVKTIRWLSAGRAA